MGDCSCNRTSHVLSSLFIISRDIPDKKTFTNMIQISYSNIDSCLWGAWNTHECDCNNNRQVTRRRLIRNSTLNNECEGSTEKIENCSRSKLEPTSYLLVMI